MGFSFIPKTFNFFELFDKQADHALAAAEFFKQIASAGAAKKEDVVKIKEIEHQGDGVVHNIAHELNNSFITPFDREDIHGLSKEVDDIIDLIKVIIGRMHIYKLVGVNEDLVGFSRLIFQAVQRTSLVLKELRDLKKHAKTIKENCVEINRLEDAGDNLRDDVLAALFDSGKDPITVIKWKEIYNDCEKIMDVCEDIAHTVESLIVKQG